MNQRPKRAATVGVKYRESGSSSEEESLLDSSVAHPSDSEESVLLDSTVVAGQLDLASDADQSVLNTTVVSCQEVVPSSSAVAEHKLCSRQDRRRGGSLASVASESIVPLNSSVVTDHTLCSVESSSVAATPSMADTRTNQLIAELEALLFQLDEAVEDAEDVTSMSTSELSSSMDEVKDLRVKMVKANQELLLVSARRDYDARVKGKLDSSKKVFKDLRTALSVRESKSDVAEAARQKQLADTERMKQDALVSSFKRLWTEIEVMFANLSSSYAVDCVNYTREQMLKRHKDIPALASEFDVLRDRVDRLIQSDVVFNQREAIIDKAVNCLGSIEKKKKDYEKKAYDDLVANELTESKLKLAESMKVDVGKFSGVLGTGDDFFTFKSKFMKAYVDHPNSLLVQYIKNNHLDGRAKSCVGTLDDMENIWTRLENNFGNPTEMLQHKFLLINKMGPMGKRKSFTHKKHYMQAVINFMQDAVDVATAHDLLGEIHYGSQLGKVVGLLEPYLQTGWYKIVARENLTKPNMWLRMIIFLDSELLVVQARANATESADPESSGREKEKEQRDKDSSRDKHRDNKDGAPPRRSVVNHTTDVCALCDAPHRNSNKSFVWCKKFLEMKPKERCDLVRSKKKCLQCLDGKAKWNDKDHVKQCPVKWACQNAAHASYDRKLHFLACATHAGEADNMKLFELFKTEVLKADWQLRVFRGMNGYFIRTKSFSNRQKKTLTAAVVAANPIAQASVQIAHSLVDTVSDDICADFAAQMADAVQEPSDDICDDFAAQVALFAPATDRVTSGQAASVPANDDGEDEICADFAAQIALVVADSHASETVVQDSEDDPICADFAAQIDGVNPVTLIDPTVPVTTPQVNLNDEVNAEAAKVQMSIPGEEIPDAKCQGSPVFILQPVPFNNHVFNLLFDTGCETFVCRRAALDFLPNQCKRNIWPGPVLLHGVGECEVTSPHGHYEVKLPIHDGRLATFSGLCLDSVTGAMPPYPVREVRRTIVDAYIAAGGKESDLPEVPALVGGETDFLFGMAYNWFLPQRLFVLPSGLAIYESVFVGVDGTRGCIGGNHEMFAQCEKQFLESTGGANASVEFHAFLRQRIKLYNDGYRVCLDHDSLPVDGLGPLRVAIADADAVPARPKILFSAKARTCTVPTLPPVHHCAVCRSCRDCTYSVRVLSTRSKLLGADGDAAGTVHDYRCPRCRECSNCKSGERIENVSTRLEREQSAIDASIFVDYPNNRIEALLPFMEDPALKLAPNREIALKVYRQQTKKLSRDNAAKEAVLKSEDKLQQAGHVDWVSNLTAEQKTMLHDADSHFYMPWRFVVNQNSISTPVRVVFDASAKTSSGLSINDILPKGINSLNSLLEIWIRFRAYVVAIHTDIKMMYNVIKLKPEHWTFQRYLWDNELDPVREPQEKVIKTVIYGVVSSGNQAQSGLRVCAKDHMEGYPTAALAVADDTYVDDCGSGADDMPQAELLCEDLVALLAKGGFQVKGFTFSTRPPPAALTKDGESVSVLGNKWYSESDEVSLSFGPLKFAERGKRGTLSNQIPEDITKRMCMGKVHELFDICGMVAPIMCTLKLDLSDLFKLHQDWDAPISSEDREKWLGHFNTLLEIGNIRFPRVVIPEGAVSLKMELLSAGDASERMACAACYARFELKDGQFSCQLLLAKTKILCDDTTIPRGELLANVLSSYILQVVVRALKNRVLRRILVTDSEIALYWMNNDTKQLKPFVRNRVIEVNRFSELSERFHIASELNPADIGTRKGATIEDVSPGSEWQDGKPWMRLPFSIMRESCLSSVDDIKYRNEQLAEIKRESAVAPTDLSTSGFLVVPRPMKKSRHECFLVDRKVDPVVQQISTKVKERLEFSNYLFDPNRYAFHKVVRVMAFIIKAVKLLLKRWKCSKAVSECYSRPTVAGDLIKANKTVFEQLNLNHDPAQLSDDDLQYSLDYFFRKTTAEVKQFADPKQYKHTAYMKNDILLRSSRVDPGNISFVGKMTDVMIDLSSGSFEVPVVDHFSPVAFSVVNHIHWNHPTAKHSGVESTIRYTMNVVHILGVRDLAKAFRRQCTRCRYLLKRMVEIPMAPASKHQLCVAPPFYVTQCDLCGPFKAYSKHNRRTTLKVWVVTFVCATTGATSLKIMEGYDATQFLLSFSRFSCDAGFPKLLLIDEGSQLVRGCQNMKISMCDVSGVMNTEFGVHFQTCPVGGHNFHGKAERKIRAVQETMIKSIPPNERLSTIEWETLCSSVSNTVNNLPVAIGNETEDLECVDLLTPNRLKLGRNNDRSPIGPIEITDKFDRILQHNAQIFNVWWEAWLTTAVPKLVPQPKWFRDDGGVRVGDVVIFKRRDSILAGVYQYGIIDAIKESADRVARTVDIRYRNSDENIDRFTSRSARSVVVIHRVDELNIMEELGNAALLGKEVLSVVVKGA